MFKKINAIPFSSKLLLTAGIAFFVFFCKPILAQQTASDSLEKNKQSLLRQFLTDTAHSPKKAMIYSAILPGAGQIYNKKYWKVPLVYAGFAAIAYSFNFNHSQFIKYKNEYIYRKLNPKATGIYTVDQLNILQENYRRYRDFSTIGFLAFYLLNFVDAGVDAHLMNFNVDENLSVRLNSQTLWCNKEIKPALGFQLSLKF